MKFKIKQEKFLEMLEKMLMKNMFPSSVINTKNGILFSIQREDHGRATRFVKFNKTYFEEIDDSMQTIELDIEKTLSLVKNIPSGTLLTIETVDNKFSIKKNITNDKNQIIGEKGITKLSYKEPQGNILTDLPFVMKDNIPHVKGGEIPLSTYLSISLDDLKSVTNYGTPLKTELYKFFFESGRIGIRIGELHSFSDYDIEYINGSIKNGNDLEVIFAYGIPEIADTFREKELYLKTATNCPGWFYENNDDYLLGILIPPFIMK